MALQLQTGGLLEARPQCGGVIKASESVKVVNHSIRLSLSSARIKKTRSPGGVVTRPWQVTPSSDTMATMGLGDTAQGRIWARADTQGAQTGDQGWGNSWFQTGWCQPGVSSVKGRRRARLIDCRPPRIGPWIKGLACRQGGCSAWEPTTSQRWEAG